MLLKPHRLALAQTNAVLGDVAKNVEHHASLIEQAIVQKADAIIFPELSLTGYMVRDLNFDIAFNPYTSKQLDRIKKLSEKITVICGAIEEDDRGAVFNSALVYEEGDLRHLHRKIYPPTYGIFEERRYFSDGRDLRAFNSSRLGRIGLLVCEDLWHPVLPYLLAHDDAQMLIAIAASPTRLDTGDDAFASTEPQNYTVNREHHAAYARLHGIFVAFVNRVGVEDGVNFWGGSELVAPSGETLARSAFFDEDLTFVDVDPCYIRQARQLSRHFLDDDLRLTDQLLSQLLERK